VGDKGCSCWRNSVFAVKQIRNLLVSLRRREAVLLLVSASVLSYQVILVRTFSIGQWHHFAYMVISIALLGFGASGTLLAALDRRVKNAATAQQLHASRSAWFAFSTTSFAVALPVSFWLTQHVPFEPFLVIWDRQQWLYLGCFYLVLFVPFFAAATAIGLALTSESEKCPRLYAFNLVGSGAGALFAVVLLSVARVEWSLFGVVALAQGAAVLALLDASFLVERDQRRLFATVGIVIMAILTVTYVFHWPSVRLSQYKGLSYALNLPQAHLVAERSSALGRVDVVASPAIREAPGLSLVAPDEAVIPRQLGLYVDAETAGAITAFDGDTSKLIYLDSMTTAAPYFALQDAARGSHVCVLGPGAARVSCWRCGTAHSKWMQSNSTLTCRSCCAGNFMSSLADFMTDPRFASTVGKPAPLCRRRAEAGTSSTSRLLTPLQDRQRASVPWAKTIFTRARLLRLTCTTSTQVAC